jgi:hypothetical protein
MKPGSYGDENTGRASDMAVFSSLAARMPRFAATVGDNISAFGGDLGGSPSGDSPVARWRPALLTSPPAAGLFHRVLAQSGPLGIPMPGPYEADRVGEGYLQVLEPAAGRAQRLRELPAESRSPASAVSSAQPFLAVDPAVAALTRADVLPVLHRLWPGSAAVDDSAPPQPRGPATHRVQERADREPQRGRATPRRRLLSDRGGIDGRRELLEQAPADVPRERTPELRDAARQVEVGVRAQDAAAARGRLGT